MLEGFDCGATEVKMENIYSYSVRDDISRLMCITQEQRIE